MKRILAFALIILMLFSAVSCTPAEKETDLKYVFLFIGDGMSFNTVQLARDCVGEELAFTDFDSVGVFTNHDKSSLIPDSASTATAMATGNKTSSGKIAESANGIDLESIATLLKNEKNMKVGIVTTANINHATPGAFYAHSSSRYNYHEIGSYLPSSDFDLFIGGQFLDESGKGDLVTLAENGGYTVCDTVEEIEKMGKGGKHLVFDPDCDSTGMMSFAVDREDNAFTLSDYLQIAIDNLYGDEGFFIMCEGGRIDSALHANDASTAVGEMIAFSDAVSSALDFYKKHPDETLILVTGDHETGGLSLGYTGTGYELFLDNLLEQRLSYLAYDENYATLYDESITLDAVIYDLEMLFGLDSLTEYELERIEYAFEKTLLGTDSYTEADHIAYSTRTPLTVEAVRLVSERAGIGFSTFVHTGAPMGMWAKGEGEEVFAGTYDNTDVYNKLYALFFE